MTLGEYIKKLREKNGLSDKAEYIQKCNAFINNELAKRIGANLLKLRNINDTTFEKMEECQYENADITILYILSEVLKESPASFVEAEAEDLSLADIDINDFYYIAQQNGYDLVKIDAIVDKNAFTLFGEKQTKFMLKAYGKYKVNFICGRKKISCQDLFVAFDMLCRSVTSKSAKETLEYQFPTDLKDHPIMPLSIKETIVYIDDRLFSLSNTSPQLRTSLAAAGGDKTTLLTSASAEDLAELDSTIKED